MDEAEGRYPVQGQLPAPGMRKPLYSTHDGLWRLKFVGNIRKFMCFQPEATEIEDLGFALAAMK